MARMVTRQAMQLAPASLEATGREAWLALRREGIGGSDIAAILGMARRGQFGRTAWQVYLDKTGQYVDADIVDDDAEEQAWFGHQAEVIAARRFRMKNPGTRLVRVGMMARADAPWMRVNADRLVRGCERGPCGWECKTRSAYLAGQWGRDGGDPDQVPEDVALQCHWSMIVTGYAHWHLSVVIGGNELRSYRLDANPGLHATMAEEARWFWHDCVLAGVAPPIDAAERTGRVLARLWDTDPDKIITADDATIALDGAYRAALAAAAAAQAEADQLRHELMAWTEDAEVVLHPDGHKLWTWKQNGPFRETAFRADRPQTWAEYARPASRTDTQLLEEKDPALYRQYRARTFRLSAHPKEHDHG